MIILGFLLWTKKCRCYCLRFWVMRSIKGEVMGCYVRRTSRQHQMFIIHLPHLGRDAGSGCCWNCTDEMFNTLRWPVTEDRQDERKKNPQDRLNLQDYELVKYYRKTVHKSTIGLITYSRNCSWSLDGLILINLLREQRSSILCLQELRLYH